jgi:hypothetical protein
LKLVQQRAGDTLKAIGIGKDFLNRTPASRQLRERMDNMKVRSLCTTKEMVSKVKKPPQRGRKYLPAIHQSKD